MNEIIPVNFTFAGTTVDSGPVVQYLLSADLPKLKYAIQCGAHQQVLDSITHTEFFDLALRHYVAGYRKNLRFVNREVRDFQAFAPIVASGMIRMTIIRLRHDFIKNEWYELMPRFEKAVIKIEKLLHPNP